MANGNLFEAMAAATADRPDHRAVIFGAKTYSYRALFEEADRLAGGLAGRGLAPGSRVSVLADNRPELLILYLALARMGAVYVPVNPNLAAPEIAHIIDHATPAAIFLSDPMRSRFGTAQAIARHRPDILSLDAPPDADSDWRQLAAGAALGASRASGADPAVICYTSATTGVPKGVRASHAAEIESARSFAQIWNLGPRDCLLLGLPLAYIYGLTTAALTGLVAGMPLVLMERFDAPRALELIETHRCSVFPAVPTMHAMLVEAVRLSKWRFDLSSLRQPISSGARLTAQVAADFLATVGVPINEFYAASEIRPVFAYDLSRGQKPRGGTVGPVAPGVEARIVGDDERPVPVGVEGNLFVRSPTLMIDYYRDPELTASVMRDGWFDSGDRASVDADGIYSIGGRNKEMINRGGAKVAPAEIEAVLLAHPGVREAAVLGVPDPAFGEQVKAVVVLHPGEPVSASSLRQHCRARLADFKVPGIVVFVDALPVGPTGKLLRRALIDL